MHAPTLSQLILYISVDPCGFISAMDISTFISDALLLYSRVLDM